MTDTRPGSNGWEQWSRHILAELERFDDALTAMAGEVRQLRVDLAVLQTRASLYAGIIGLVGGALAALLTIGARLVR